MLKIIEKLLDGDANFYAHQYANSLPMPERIQELKEILTKEIEKGLDGDVEATLLEIDRCRNNNKGMPTTRYNELSKEEMDLFEKNRMKLNVYGYDKDEHYHKSWEPKILTTINFNEEEKQDLLRALIKMGFTDQVTKITYLFFKRIPTAEETRILAEVKIIQKRYHDAIILNSVLPEPERTEKISTIIKDYFSLEELRHYAGFFKDDDDYHAIENFYNLYHSMVYVSFLPEPERTEKLSEVKKACVAKGDLSTARKVAELLNKNLEIKDYLDISAANRKKKDFRSSMEVTELLPKPEKTKELMLIFEDVLKTDWHYSDKCTPENVQKFIEEIKELITKEVTSDCSV